jgi:hypothetical protein
MVQNLQVISGNELLAQAAVDAVKQWTYRPYLLNGVATEVDTTVTVNFRLGGVRSAPAGPASQPPMAPSDSVVGQPIPEGGFALGPPVTVKRPSGPLRISGGVMAGMILTKSQPECTGDAIISGTVVLHAIIGKDGRVQSLKFVSGPELLSECVIKAVKQWTYKQLMMNGEPVDIETTISVTLDFGAPVGR